MSPQAEGLEERVLLTSLRWVGDVGADWNTQTAGGDTNWSDDLLPQDGDTLIFDDTGSGTVTNNTGDGRSYTLLFESGTYVVNGDSITLDNADEQDVVVTAGTVELNTPLVLVTDSTIHVDDDSAIHGILSGDGGLTKSGAGALSITSAATFTGETTLNGGTLLLPETWTASSGVSVNGTAFGPGGLGETARQSVSGATFSTDSVFEVEIGGATAGAASGGYDQLAVAGTAALDGTLKVSLVDGYVPEPGTTFEILSFDEVTGNFHAGSGLFDPESGAYFEVVQEADRLQLVARELPLLNQVNLAPLIGEASDSIGQFFNVDYFGFSADQFALGTLTIDASLTVGDFFSVSGSFALTSEARTITLADGSSVETAAFQIGGSGVSAFVGTGGPYLRDSDGDGDIDGDDVPNPEAVGLSLSGVDFGLSLFAEANTSLDDVEVWTALLAEAGAVEFVGNDDVRVSANDLRIEINDVHNSGSGVDPHSRVIDFAASPVSVPTGEETSIEIGFAGAEGELRRAAGNLNVGVGDFVTFSGDVAIGSSHRSDVALADESSVNVEQLTLAANDVSVFVGNNGGTEDATGLQLGGVDLALVLSTNAADGSDLGFAVQAEAATAELLGVPNVSASGSDFSVTLHRAGAGGALIDFEAAPLEVVTGPASSVMFEMAGSAGELTEAGGHSI